MARKNANLFAKFDLDYGDHPKIQALSDGAFRAHVEMILYARKYLTDGRIPNRVANRFGFESLSELQSNDPERPSLRQDDAGDYWLHDYADHQETRDEVEARRLVNARNGKRGGRPATPVANRKETQSVTDSVTERGSEMKAETETETETEEKITSGTADAAPTPPREDVEALCTHLAEQVSANGSKRPRVTKAWRDEARRMLDIDKRNPEEAHHLINWCQANSFWKSNILSMPKFREKYDQLRLQAEQDADAKPAATTPDPWGKQPEWPSWLFDRGDEDAS